MEILDEPIASNSFEDELNRQNRTYIRRNIGLGAYNFILSTVMSYGVFKILAWPTDSFSVLFNSVLLLVTYLAVAFLIALVVATFQYKGLTYKKRLYRSFLLTTFIIFTLIAILFTAFIVVFALR